MSSGSGIAENSASAGSGAVLIFPFGVPGTYEFAEECRLQGRRVVCASSQRWDPLRKMAGEWRWLPYFNAPDFANELQSLLIDCSVTEIFCSHSMVWRLLRDNPGLYEGRAALLETQGWLRDFVPFRVAERLARLSQSETAVPTIDVPDHVLNAIFLTTQRLPGWCSADKLATFALIFADLPKGDIVEIGVWCGKSASALAILNNHFNVGSLLCVDPWSRQEVQQAEDAGVNSAMLTFDMDEVFRHFLAAMTTVGAGRANYLRMTSVAAASEFAKDGPIISQEFGATAYAGKIALLHIDGNHDTAKVIEDLVLWGNSIVPGGWLVIDDYIHAWGQGPKVIGDRLLECGADSILCSFVAGTALFIQIGSRLELQHRMLETA